MDGIVPQKTYLRLLLHIRISRKGQWAKRNMKTLIDLVYKSKTSTSYYADLSMKILSVRFKFFF